MSDLIDRQKVIDILDKAWVDGMEYDGWLHKEINEIPTAEPKKGKWINHRCDDGHHIADCNLCGETMQWWYEDVPNYCPNCGADMRGGEDGK